VTHEVKKPWGLEPEVLFFIKGGGGCALTMPFASRNEEAPRLVAPGFFPILLKCAKRLASPSTLRSKENWGLGPQVFKKKLIIGV